MTNLKKNIMILIIILCWPKAVFAGEKIEVQFKKCVDGDTATFVYQNEDYKVRFLAIDTPETKHPRKKEEPFGKEASDYTCNAISTAKKIVLEFDPGSTKKDKYNRYLAWVYVDETLLQESLIERGLAKVEYIYGNYLYTKDLQEKEAIAKERQIGLWGDYVPQKDNTFYDLIALAIILFLFILILPKLKNKKIKKIVKKANTKAKKELKTKVNNWLK